MYALALLWINAYVCRDMFFGSTAHMGSMHGFWTALATRAGSSWFHATWWPFWDNGIPFESTYPPLVPALAAAMGALRGVTPADRVSQRHGPVLHSGTLHAVPDGVAADARAGIQLPGRAGLFADLGDADPGAGRRLHVGQILDARRLYVVAVWDDTPHLAALAFLPLAILFLARSLETRRAVYYAGAALCIGLAALASAFGPVMVVLAAACLLFVLRAARTGPAARC